MSHSERVELALDNLSSEFGADVGETKSWLAALVARDADVRTLDAWDIGGRTWKNHTIPTGGVVLLQLMGSGARFEGATPDEARAMAAAWVRAQGKV